MKDEKNYQGILVSVEGIDGSGKSTFARNLSEALTSAGHSTLLTHEPGGSTLGASLRELLHKNKEIICDLSEYLLFAADRAQHFESVVIPALQDGKVVISDRMGDSSVAYQGYGRGLDVDMIKRVNAWAMQGLTPDLTFYLSLAPEVGALRIEERGEPKTSFEKEKAEFSHRVMTGYEELFAHRENVSKLDATTTPELLTKQALGILTNLLP